VDFDVLITGGDVVDGSGAPRRRLDVGISGGRVVAVDRLEGSAAARVIDARGLTVAPGFIDVHVHSELARLGGVDQFAGVLDGVTTELMSPDGFSWAPLSPDRLREVKDYLQVFYGDPDIGWDWSSVGGYLAQFRGHTPNHLVPQAPHLAIKVAAMGWKSGPPSDEEARVMRSHLVEWLDAGAVGMAASLRCGRDLRHVPVLGRVYAPADAAAGVGASRRISGQHGTRHQPVRTGATAP